MSFCLHVLPLPMCLLILNGLTLRGMTGCQLGNFVVVVQCNALHQGVDCHEKWCGENLVVLGALLSTQWLLNHSA